MISFRLWQERATIADKISPEDIVVPGPNLKVPRSKMPQILTKLLPEFFEYLRDNGIETRKEEVSADSLRPIQDEIDLEKVICLMKQTDLDTDAPPIITSDNYILDGHHRWLALLNLALQKGSKDHQMQVWRADTKIKNLLEVAKAWPKIKYKGIEEVLRWA